MTNRIYLDHNATSPLRPAAREAMAAVLDETGNASSVHREGQAARSKIEHARTQVAALVRADAKAVTFTSGATESIALALSPEIEISGRRVHFDILLISDVEHPAVRAGGRFPADRIETVPVDRDGVIDLVALEAKLTHHREAGRRAFVSVMAANNETGVIQPLREIAALVHDAEGIFHTDAVQITGRYPFDLAAADIDLISISSHKLGGPQGAGALIARDAETRVPPLLRGGGQERGARAGTENVAAIVGFGATAEIVALTLAKEIDRMAALRDRLEKEMRATASETIIFSETVLRVPNTTCFAIPGIAAETAVIAFDLEGAAVSAGAACSSGKVGPSPTLIAMKIEPEISRAAVRASLGWNTTELDVTRFLEIFARVYARLGAGSRTKAA
jgi:cysteine desulfurase